MTAVTFTFCLFIGLVFSMALGQPVSEQETGDIGYTTSPEIERKANIFELAFKSTFTTRVHVTDPEKVRTVTSVANVFEYGEHVAQHVSGALLYDDEFPFEGDYINFAAGGISGIDEGADGDYWLQMIATDQGGVKSNLDLREEGGSVATVAQDAAPVNDAESVIYGVTVVEGTGELYSSFEDRDRFYDWAEYEEKVITFELLISSERLELESWGLREEE